MVGIFENDQCFMKEKLKVVWICSISNYQIREKIKFSNTYYKKILARLFHKSFPPPTDYPIWNTNAVHEFENFSDISLTVVFPYPGIQGNMQRFSINGINYICFRPQDDNLLSFLKRRLADKKEWNYKKHRHVVCKLLEEIQPDLVHLMGAENPAYSITLLDCPKNIPTVTSLQTLMSAPGFLDNYPIPKDIYEGRSHIEQEVIKRSDYLAQRAESIRKDVRKNIKPNAIFLQMTLALGVNVNTTRGVPEYDFVYFASSVDKAGEDAIEAFALACRKKPTLKLNISGNCPILFRKKMEVRLRDLGIERNVFFSGVQETHDMVMKQIKRSKFALLPLRVDLISGTIREAMAWGLPVVTTITPATPYLNIERESVLLSDIGNFQAMADNMLRLIEDESFAEKICNNALITVSEHYSNRAFMQKWRRAYYEIVENFKTGKPFSEDIIVEN